MGMIIYDHTDQEKISENTKNIDLLVFFYLPGPTNFDLNAGESLRAN